MNRPNYYKYCTEEFLRNVELPKKTKSYTPITHGEIIDKVNAELSNAGFIIEKSEYIYTYDGKIVVSKIYIKSDKDPEMGMLFSWANSYNKMVKFSCGIGAFIYENKASFFGTEGLSWNRKHTGTANQEAFTIIEQIVDNADAHFTKIIEERDQMKRNPMSIELYGQLMGALYFEHEILTSSQVSFTNHEYKDKKSTATDKENLWGLYKLLMFGMEAAIIAKWQTSQQKLHHLIMTEYAIATDDYLSIAVGTTAQSDNPMPTIGENAGINKEAPLQPGELRETDPPEVIPAVFVDNNDDKITAVEEGLDHYTGDEDPFKDELKVAEVDFEDDGRPVATPEIPVGDTPEITGVPDGNVLSDTEEDINILTVNEHLTHVPDSELENLFPEDDEKEALLDAAAAIKDPVPIIDPVKETESFLDIKEHDVPKEVSKEDTAIEKKMKTLFGSVQPYTIEENDTQINVILNETKECFFV